MSASKVAFTTLGCRLNQAESDSMADDLNRHGITMSGPGHADLVVINTCTVTREATKASRMAIRRAVRDNPGASVVVVGCYAVSDRAEVEAIEGVDLVLGNDEKDALSKAIGLTPTRPDLLRVGFRRSGEVRTERVRANLKAQTGCDEWCTFCIIPTTRGPLKSLDVEAILEEARAKISAGAREIVLTGVHLGKFGFDEGKGDGALVSLLEDLLRIEGLARLRLSSILCRHLSPSLLDLMASEPRLCRFLHVPLQSGDDSVLKAMHRPYSASEYRDLVGAAIEQLPGLALATDIIVGFPGEDENSFQETCKMVEDLRFSKLHVFRYSARPDTAAADMPDRVPDDVKKRRSKTLIELGNDIRRQWLLSHLPGPVQVLVEDEREVDGVPVSSGQTDDHVRVWFEGEGMLGELVDVAGTGVRADGLRGELIRA